MFKFTKSVITMSFIPVSFVIPMEVSVADRIRGTELGGL